MCLSLSHLLGCNVTPVVIEPSFGIGRIIYALLEQSYWIRNPEKPDTKLTFEELLQKKKVADKSQIELSRGNLLSFLHLWGVFFSPFFTGVLSLSPMLAPTKVSVIPLFSSNTEMLEYVPKITEQLKKFNISHKVDKASVFFVSFLVYLIVVSSKTSVKDMQELMNWVFLLELPLISTQSKMKVLEFPSCYCLF